MSSDNHAERRADRPTAPHRDSRSGKAALLIIDMINCFDFPNADRILPSAEAAAECIARLRIAAREAGAPIVYVNDNFGEWHSEKTLLVERAIKGGNPITEKVVPEPDDYFVIKPQFSAFYATNLPVLLPKLGVSRLVITGVATDICVLFTAADAHMRDYAIWAPEDAVASSSERGAWALEIMRGSMGADTAPTSELTFDAWLRHLDDNGIR